MSVAETFLISTSPILALAVTACALILWECLPASAARARAGSVLAILGTLCALGCSVYLMRYTMPPVEGTAPAWLRGFFASYQLDRMSTGFYAAIAVFTLISLFLSRAQFRENVVGGEIQILLLFIAMAMMCLVSSASLLMVFLSLEFLSLPTYVLVGIRQKTLEGCEAALKYFLFGSLASAVLLFGIALLFAQCGTLRLSEIHNAVATLNLNDAGAKATVLAAMVCLLVGAGFKIGMAPFHMWVPDVYAGAPSSVTGFMGSAVKLAGFGLLIRLFWGVFAPWFPFWAPLVASLAVITMFVGNLAALVQDDLKRLFAYSSISHAGYLLLGVTAISAGQLEVSALYFYLVVYGLMFLGLFAVILLLEKQTGDTYIYQLSGLGSTHPWLAVCVAVFALSAAGIPPTAGFFAKYFVFLDVIRKASVFHVILAGAASAMGLYYYLRVLVYLYMRESRQSVIALSGMRGVMACIVVCAAVLMMLALFPGALMMLPR